MPIPNFFGYGTTRKPGCLKFNNVNIAVDNSYDFGPTSSTGIWSTYVSGSSITDNIIVVAAEGSPSVLPSDTASESDYWSCLIYGSTTTPSVQAFYAYLLTGQTNMYSSWLNVQIGDTVTSGLTFFIDSRATFVLPNTRYFPDLSGNQFNTNLSPGVNANTRIYSLAPLCDGVDDYFSMSANSTIYTSNFTWQIVHRYINGTTALYPLISSGSGATKNFNIYYSDLNTSGTSMVIETSATNYSSTTVGTNYNGFSGKNGVQTSIRGQGFVTTTIVKEGNEFRIYWDDATLKWVVNITNWTLNNTFPMYFAGNSNLSLFSTIAIGDARFYNRVLSTNEISRNFSGITQTGWV
jgi:hypothetical protein